MRSDDTILKRLCGNIAAGRFDREMNKLIINGIKWKIIYISYTGFVMPAQDM